MEGFVSDGERNKNCTTIAVARQLQDNCKTRQLNVNDTKQCFTCLSHETDSLRALYKHVKDFKELSILTLRDVGGML